jgi:hypothetical protein
VGTIGRFSCFKNTKPAANFIGSGFSIFHLI